MNHLAQEARETALKRGQITEDNSRIHEESFLAIHRELQEYKRASEEQPSEHISAYTEAQEELADILIICLTELHRRGIDVEEIIKTKIKFNKTRL